METSTAVHAGALGEEGVAAGEGGPQIAFVSLDRVYVCKTAAAHVDCHCGHDALALRRSSNGMFQLCSWDCCTWMPRLETDSIGVGAQTSSGIPVPPLCRSKSGGEVTD